MNMAKEVKDVLVNGKLIPCTIEYSIQNDGIGIYEFWGASYYDHGTDYVEVEDIVPVVSDEALNKYIDDNFESLAEQVGAAMDYAIEDYYSSQEQCDGDAWSGGFAENH